MGFLGKLFGRSNETDDERDLREALENRKPDPMQAPMPAPMPDPVPAPSSSAPLPTFSLTIDDKFSLKDKGVVVVGLVRSGSLKTGDRVLINGKRETTVNSIEAFRRVLDTASEGQHVALLLDGLTPADVNRGDVITNAM